VATLQVALNRAHEQVRERDAVIALRNGRIETAVARAVVADASAIEIQQRLDRSRAQRAKAHAGTTNAAR
jgi:hypothetical protein